MDEKETAMRNLGDSEANFIADAERLNCPACGGSGHVDDATALAHENAALLARLEVAERDARRYRWVRECDADGEDQIMIRASTYDHDELFTGVELDQAIDAAIAAKEGRSAGDE